MLVLPVTGGPTEAPPAPTPETDGGGPAPYDPADHADDVVALQVSAFAVLTLLGAAGSWQRTAAKKAAWRPEGSVVFTEVESADEGLDGGFDAVGARRGDRSWTWRWPGTPSVDRLSLTVPARLAPRSPLLARVVNDAGYLRAMFGSASLLLHGVAMVLAVLAVGAVDGQALPPPFALAVGLAMIGIFDAAAGLVGVVVFVAGVTLFGGASSADGVRTLLGVATLWFAAPLIAGTARPLRRPPTLTALEHWDRTADVVIASLIGAWAVQSIIQGLPGLSGLDLPIADQASVAALLVLAGLAVRMVVETVAAHAYPWRLSRVQPADLASPGVGQRLAANALVLGIFMFVAVSYLGLCWQLVVGGALFILPKLLALLADRFPKSPRIYAVTPRGVLAVVVMLVIGSVVGTIVLGLFASGREAIRNSFVILALPGLALAVLELLGQEDPERELRWRHQLLGVPLLAFGVLLAQGVISI